MKTIESPRLTISSFFVFILIHALQFGPEYVSMSMKPIQLAGQDAWMSVVLCGIVFHAVIWMIYRILNRSGTDLIQIHHRFFGKWAGGGLNFIFIVYFLVVASFQMRFFIEIIQVWLFPGLKTWRLAFVMLLLTYYIVSGGFRVIVGICMFSLVRHITILAMFFPVLFFHFDNLTPVFDHSLQEIVKAGKEFTFPFLGVEALFFCYTFIESPRQSQKWAHWANFVTTVSYALIVLFSLLMFKPEQLEVEIWPQLTKYKFIHFPFIDRFEYVGAASQILWIIPIVCFSLWASSRIGKFVFAAKQLTILPILTIMVFIAVCLIPGRSRIEAIETLLSRFGFYFIVAYVPFMYLVGVIREKAGRTV